MEVDLKRYARVEKIPGGEMKDCEVLAGVMFNKDVTHSKMRKDIVNPRVVLLDCPLEYKKNESNTNFEVTKESDWEALLMQEEKEVERMCVEVLKHKPDVVITEKGVSDLAQHFLLKGNCAVIRRVRKMDNNRIARCCGAKIVNRVEEIVEADVGTQAGKFFIRKIGEEYFTYLVECEDPKACTVILRGGTKDVLNEIERNLHDAFNVSRNILVEPMQVAGGGATEMAISCRLMEKARSIEGPAQYPYMAVASALEVIPRALAQNCGADVVRTITELRSKHAAKQGNFFGIDGDTGKVCDTFAAGILDSFVVKQQTIKSAIETAATIVRIDEIVSGVSKKKDGMSAPTKSFSQDKEED